jgi:hypothetical protein
MEATVPQRWANPPSVAQGGKGVVGPGGETCRKQANTIRQYMQRLADDALAMILRRAFAIANETST